VRKIVSGLLMALGGFLLVAAVVATTWAPGQVKRAPLDTDSVTRLSGTAAALPNGDTNQTVRAVSVTKADSEVSDDEVVVYASYTCLVIDTPDTPDCGVPGEGEDADPNLVTAGEPEVFATDRRTGVALNDSAYLPDGTPETEGLVNKFPFDTEQTSYEFWDGVLDATVTAEFEDVEEVNGLETYRFNYVVTDEPAKISGEIDGLYSMDKTMWIEPKTGQIIDQEQHDVRKIDDQTLLDVNLSFTDEQVQVNVDDANDNLSSLTLITSTIPLLGFIGGPLLILGGVALLMTGRRKADA
jgi:hypothetical protein